MNVKKNVQRVEWNTKLLSYVHMKASKIQAKGKAVPENATKLYWENKIWWKDDGSYRCLQS
jgi:hypothetical protein